MLGNFIVLNGYESSWNEHEVNLYEFSAPPTRVKDVILNGVDFQTEKNDNILNQVVLG